jgi:phosphatidate cytidylyltransferase
MAESASTGGKSRSGSDLRIRVASGIVLAAVAILAAWLGGWPAALVMTVVAAIVFGEWAAMTAQPTPQVRTGLGTVAAASVLLAGLGEPALGIVVALIGALFALAILRSAWLAAGIVYAAALGIGLTSLLGDAAFGLQSVAFVLAVVWASDTGAYLVGRTVGGPKLWPAVSPGKTWSGFVGGLAAGVLAGVAVILIARLPVSLGTALAALALALVSVAGDLFESAVKRRFGVKDSGTLIPGHGGMMDRVDGLTFAAAAAALLGLAHAGPQALGRGLLLW